MDQDGMLWRWPQGRCRESGDFSDLTLLCEEEEFKVHKTIVYSQSNVLRAACAGHFKVYSPIDHYLGKNTDGSLGGINGNLQVRGWICNNCQANDRLLLLRRLQWPYIWEHTTLSSSASCWSLCSSRQILCSWSCQSLLQKVPKKTWDETAHRVPRINS